MENNSTDMSRRNFLKVSACAAAVAGLGSLLNPVFASEKAKITKVKLQNIPTDPVEVARSSELVGNSWKYLMQVIGTLKDPQLKQAVSSIYNDTTPTFALKYADTNLRRKVYNELLSKQLIDSKLTPFENFLPPFDAAGIQPQPFYSAPGSGYQSHHSYPGGLVTHTAVNVIVTLALLESYKEIMNYDAIYDEAVAGQLLHDLAKPWVFQWQKDGSSLKEFQIGGTGAHHIFSIAESIHRGVPANVVVAQACAHNHPGSADDEKIVVKYIKAACVLCGCDPVAKHLLAKDGDHLITPHRQAGYMVHLGDHDFVLSVPAAKESVVYLQQVATDVYGLSKADLNGIKFNSIRNYVGANYSFMHYQHDLSVAKDPVEAAKLAALACIEK
ncbi:MAG: twin-arginine translocation signal domain-containing protein [Succinivibrio sp.]